MESTSAPDLSNCQMLGVKPGQAGQVTGPLGFHDVE